MQHIFRQAGIENIAEIKALARRIWDEAYGEILSKKQIDYMLQMMYSGEVITEELLNGTVWDLIIANDIPCGYLSYVLAEDNSVKLSKIYIEKDFRRTSIAACSLSRVKHYAVRNGKDYIYLTVNKNNKQAIRAYEKNGFAITAAVVTDIGHGFVMDDFIMKLFMKSYEK
ncbi:MAG: GNAT family N-acetyltransferase [Thermodesulfovibrionales bacterium]